MRLILQICLCCVLMQNMWSVDNAPGHSLEELLLVQHPSGDVLAAIGNAYVEQSDFGRAIAYYTKALQQIPRDAKVRHNMLVVRKKADSPPQMHHWSGFIGYASAFERHMVALGAIWITLLLYSLHIWFGLSRVVWTVAYGITVCIIILCGWYTYGRVPCGIIVSATVPKDGSTLLQIGEEVDVLTAYPDRHEVLVETTSGVQVSILDKNIVVCS